MNVTIKKPPVSGRVELKQFRLNVDQKSLGEDRTFDAYASTWDVDEVDDRIQDGAFTRTLKDRFETPLREYGYSDIPLFRDHESNIGITLEMREDRVGLWVKARVSRTSLGNDTLELLRDRAISRMSIGYIVTKARYEQDPRTGRQIRVIEELILLEVSVVTFPANDKARVLQVKSRWNPEQVLGPESKEVDAMSWLVELKKWGAEQARELKAGRRLSGVNQSALLEAYGLMTQVLMSAGALEASAGIADAGGDAGDPAPEGGEKSSDNTPETKTEPPVEEKTQEIPPENIHKSEISDPEVSSGQVEEKNSDNYDRVLAALRGIRVGGTE